MSEVPSFGFPRASANSDSSAIQFECESKPNGTCYANKGHRYEPNWHSIRRFVKKEAESESVTNINHEFGWTAKTGPQF